ncbi:MAG TPA: permease-like cell division protein FtsX [Thermoclostridium sp.]
MKNAVYFIKESVRIFRSNKLSNIFSFFGTFLILFLLALVVGIWSISSQLTALLKEEAEISAYFKQDIQNTEELLHMIEQIDGVRNVRLVDKEEARSRMEKILGEESGILDLFDENPFEAYFEVKINLEKTDSVFTQISGLNGIDYVRENREVLEQIEGVSKALEALGYLVIAAVSITTLVIISHMIRQGIYQNREQIKTFMLLGAPDNFINFPYILLGFLLTFGGGIAATVLINILINQGYSRLASTLPFIPLPPKSRLSLGLTVFLLSASAALGILGSLFGVSTSKKNN